MLNERVLNPIGEALNLASEEVPLSQVSQYRKVCTVLLASPRDDLCCAGLLALRGDLLPACSLVAIYEAAFTERTPSSNHGCRCCLWTSSSRRWFGLDCN